MCLCSRSDAASNGMRQLPVSAKGGSAGPEPVWRSFTPQNVIHRTKKEGRKDEELAEGDEI